MSDTNTRENEIGAIWIKVLDNGDKRVWGTIKIDGKEVRFKGSKNPFYKEPKHPIYRLYKDEYVAPAKVESKVAEIDL
jgi:hypothetical protein